MATTYTIKLVFTTDSGTKTFNITPSKMNVSAAILKTAMDTIINNNDIFKVKPLTKRAASFIAQSVTPVDMSELEDQSA